jgi:DNA-binding MarR family transcriptional regulator/N-acetylglutamate synthase-like GNAT family acetyltransferase
MDFYKMVGKMAIGSRLRRLNERIIEDSAKIYGLYGVGLDAKWFPVFYALHLKGEASVTEIAKLIGHSHPSVSQIVKEMKKQGILVTDKSTEDGRVNIVKLSEKGTQIIPELEKQCADVNQTVEALLSETQHNLWKAIEEVEFLLSESNLYERTKRIMKNRERQNVEIVDYAPEFHDDFRNLNYDWIEKYFNLEKIDIEMLSNPDEKILKPGGHIVMARYNNEIVGTCALLKMDEDTYELSKMAVKEQARGLGIGRSLGKAIIDKAYALGAKSVYLESNTALKPAIKLYQNLGFKKTVGSPSPYERCNIQMQLILNNS